MPTGKFTDVSDNRGEFIYKQCLKVKSIISFETSVTLYQWTRCNTPEDFNLQQQGSENLKPHKGNECSNKSFDEWHQMRYGNDSINPLAPNDLYIRHTAQLTSRRSILNIYSTNTLTEYF